MRVHMSGLGDCSDYTDGMCMDDTSYDNGPTGSGGGSSIPGTTQTTAQTAAQIANAANQLLITSQGRGVYTANGVQYVQPQGNASNVFAATNTTGSVSAAGSIGGISTSTLMLMAIAAIGLMLVSKSGR